MDLTPKQQTSEAIRQAETIVILTGQHPSVDQVTAVMALAALLRKFEKKVTAIISDNPPASVQVLDLGAIDRGLGGSRDFVLKLDVSKVEVDKLRYEVEGSKLNVYLTPVKGSFAPSDVTFGYGEFHYDLAIVLGVPTRARIDRVFEQNSVSFETIPVVNLDFHRSNENYGAVNLIEPNASSLCEMLVALSESLQSGSIDGDIATALLMGIMASTDRFTAAHTSPKSLTVAAQMMAAGARQQAVVKALYRDGKSEPRGNDRPDRPERSSDRPGGGDRGNQSSFNLPRPPQPATPSPQRSVIERPPLEPKTATASVFTEPIVASDAPLPAAQSAPSDVSEADLPIIEPGHIELSEPDSQESAQDSANLEPEFERATPERPQSMPVADFAAAAEMFNRDEPMPGTQTVGDES